MLRESLKNFIEDDMGSFNIEGLIAMGATFLLLVGAVIWYFVVT